MGRDKALLPWGRGTLLDHALARLRACCGSVRILAGERRRYAGQGAPVEVDVAHGAGALGGLLTALGVAGQVPVLILAVDVPLVPVPLLGRLLELLPAFDAVVPSTPGGPEPLVAAYGPACREPAERAIGRGDLKMTSFWPEVRVREVGPDELAPFGDPEELFRNLNTLAEYRTVKARAGA